MITKKDMDSTQLRLYETLKFMLKLLVAGAIFRGILWIYPDTVFIQAVLADLIGAMLSSSGFEVAVEGISIFIAETEYVITQDCLGWKSVALFTGLVYASSKRTLEHLKFILQGFAIILIANIFRVYTTVILAEKGIISFSVIHNFLWTWSLSAIVLGIWGYWFIRINEREPIYQQRIKEKVAELTE